MALPQVDNRLASVNRVRAHQRDWIAETRRRVAEGEPFAICNGDEFEEVFIAMGIPVLAINYWNFLIAAQGKTDHYSRVLHEHGYAGAHFFGLALASTLAPEEAPWGGLPRPALICGSIRSEMELRVCELWAKAYDCPCVPLDFSFPSPSAHPVPVDWWNYTHDRWRELVDPTRLELRIEQERSLLAYVENLTGRTFSLAEMTASMELLNQQMDYWRKAKALIGQSKPCPVHVRDQMSMYQAMWHRGTPTGVELIRDYHDEIAERVKAGVGAYRNEKIRLYYHVQIPPWHDYIEDKYGAVTVANFYSGVPDLYARTIDDGGPLAALAGRHLFLFGFNAERIVKEAIEHRCDAVIAVEHFDGGYPSRERQVCEAAGLPYLALPREADDDEVRGMVSRFIEERLSALL
ncbi:MAG: 2-hydroxyacyl-CoA dehydratase family protein [Caulobacteraceae bacterium]